MLRLRHELRCGSAITTTIGYEDISVHNVRVRCVKLHCIIRAYICLLRSQGLLDVITPPHH